MIRRLILLVAAVVACGLSLSVATISAGAAAITADHHSVGEFEFIPDSVVQAITADYEILYVHTSHGSQIVTGISLLEDEDPLYARPYFLEIGDDLGHSGDTSWVPSTRSYLESPSYDFNMAMFSWCGGVSDNTEAGINIYLAKMEELEADYPDVIFIYMTGHLDGSGPDGNLYLRNNQIRNYSAAHEKILFDFADIESYDPDGTWYPDETDACGWCSVWCAENPPCPECGCAHSHCFNCYLKGKAWWWMMAMISGWNSEPAGCGDADSSGDVDIDDAVYLVNYIFSGGPPPNPFEVGDVGCADGVDIDDVVYLVVFIFGGGPVPCDPNDDGIPDC
jgi:hypothetical protein